MDFVNSLKLFGIEGKEIPCLLGKYAPTVATKGAVGSLYMDTNTGYIYKCTAVENGVYTWRGDEKTAIETLATLVEDVATNISRINNLIAMSENKTHVLECKNVTEDGYTYDPCTATIETNGFVAKLTVNFPEQPRIKDRRYLIATIPGHLLPMENMEEGGLSIIDGEISHLWTGPSLPIEASIFTVYYPLKYAPVAELTDIRLCADGTVYSTAGDAVRYQIRAMDTAIQGLRAQLFEVPGYGGIQLPEPFESRTANIKETGYYGVSKKDAWLDLPGGESDEGFVLLVVQYTPNYNLNVAFCIDTGMIATRIVNRNTNEVWRDWEEPGGGGTGGGDIPSMDAIVEAVLAALPNGDEVEY